MDPLAGWTVAVTAERRAAEQAEMLQRRGATVILAPAVKAERVADDELRECTEGLIAQPPDVVVATTGPGVRTWVASSWTWGGGERLVGLLARADVVARSAGTAGTLLGEGVQVGWWPESERLIDVLAHLEAKGLDGRRVAVQAHGSDITWFNDALRAAGADVVPVPVYQLAAAGEAPLSRLREAALSRQLDAVTFTSSSAVRTLAAAGTLVDDLASSGTVSACIGPVTGAAARDAGFADVLEASPSRLGPLIRCLSDHMAARGRDLAFAGVPVRVQGAVVAIDGDEVRLTPRERTLLEAMLGSDGAVVSKRTLCRLAWEADVSEHTVEVTVNRLRRKLGPAALALETSSRRGYRLAVA